MEIQEQINGLSRPARGEWIEKSMLKYDRTDAVNVSPRKVRVD